MARASNKTDTIILFSSITDSLREAMEDFIYVRVAAGFQQQIEHQLLKAGDRLPSVRTLARELGISISSAYKAYTELEASGLIESRPKSGYYVRSLKKRGRSLPTIKNPVADLLPESVAHRVGAIFARLREGNISGLAVAAPHVSLLPVAALNKSMLEALRSTAFGCANYEEKEGNLLLRNQIARNAFKSGVVSAADEVITTQGCNEALLFCLRALTKPGDVVAIESPAYFGMFNIMLSLGLNVMEIPVDPETGVDLDYLERACEAVPIAACMFITNFNNPSGSCMPDQHKKRLVNFLTHKQIPLIEDDIYGDTYFGKTRPRTCKSYDSEGWVLLCSSISKSVAPGYRVGWCLPGRFRERFLQVKMVHSITSAGPTQVAIGRFFESGRYETHIRGLRRTLHNQCIRYTQAIETHFPGETRVSRPTGGYSLWVELPEGVDALKLHEEAKPSGINFAPGHIFSIDQRFKNFIRVSFGAPYDTHMDGRFAILGKLVRAQQKKSSYDTTTRG